MKIKTLFLLFFLLLFINKLFPIEKVPSEGIAKSAIDSYLKGDLDTAMNLLEGIIQDNQNDKNSKTFLVKIYIEKINDFITDNNRAGAKNYTNKALKIDPENKDLKDLSKALDMDDKNESIKEIVKKTAQKKTEEIKKTTKPVDYPLDYYSKFINELAVRDEKLSVLFQSGTNKIIRTQQLYLIYFILFSVILIVIIFIIVDFLQRKQRYYMENTHRMIFEKLGITKSSTVAIENKKIKNISIIDAEFTEQTEFETGKRLLEDYLNDENDKVKIKAILALNKYDRKKSIELIDEIIDEEEIVKLELISENIVDYPADYAVEVLIKLAAIENEEIKAFVFQGLKKIVKQHELTAAQKEKVKGILIKAKEEGWII